jgi:uncharacterized lipoprotein YbaY
MIKFISPLLFRLWFPFLLFVITACAEFYTAENTITGQLKLFLHQQSPVGLYVRFDLVEVVSTSRKNTIASSGFKEISEHPIKFSLEYLPEQINQQKKYRLFATVSEDAEGANEISFMSSPVLTQGHPSTLMMAIQPMVEPIE